MKIEENGTFYRQQKTNAKKGKRKTNKELIYDMSKGGCQISP
jgi:hypothetical protein